MIEKIDKAITAQSQAEQIIETFGTPSNRREAALGGQLDVICYFMCARIPSSSSKLLYRITSFPFPLAEC